MRPRSTSSVTGPARGGFELPGNSAHCVLHRAAASPTLIRLAAHVVQNQTRIPIGRNFSQVRVEGKAAGIVEDFDAILQGALRDLGFIGVKRQRNP